MFPEGSNFFNELENLSEKEWGIPKHYIASLTQTNPLCGDSSTSYLISWNDGKIHDLMFHGDCCSLVKISSLSLYRFSLQKTPDEIWNKTSFLKESLTKNTSLGDFISTEWSQFFSESILSEVAKRPHRWKCLLLPWQTLSHLLKNHSHPVMKS